MPLNLYDTLTRETREAFAMDGNSFRFYCCGPTVYGPAHIGNFRTFVMQDVFRRVLETSGHETLHVFSPSHLPFRSEFPSSFVLPEEQARVAEVAVAHSRRAISPAILATG